MDLQYNYWFFKNALSKKFCEELIKYGNSKKDSVASVGIHANDLNFNEKKDRNKLKKIRRSNVVFLNDLFLYNKLQPFVKTANLNAGWNFQWDWTETMQFTKYKGSQKGFYDWHMDSTYQPYTNSFPAYNGKIRKLSVTVSLSDNKTYEGGELQFYLNSPKLKEKDKIKTCEEIKTQGSIVVFPSHLWHRVTPVTKGTRYSLVLWNLGLPWK